MKGTLMLLGGLIVFSAGCTTESLQRTGYETLQNIEQERCLRNLSSPCPERESYDEYQRNTRGLRASE